jgi:hypothetical protein
VAIIVTDLNNRATWNKQARKRNRLGQCAAAVGAQIDDDAVNVLLLQLLQLHFDIIGQANVEARNIEHADFFFTNIVNAHFNRAIFQTDFLAR